MNSFTSEKRTAKKSPLEPSRSSGRERLSPSPANSELLGSQIAPFSPPSHESGGESHAAGGFSSMSEGGASLLGGPIQAKKPPKISEPVLQDTEEITAVNEKGKKITFMSTQSRALYEMVQNATDEQLRTNETLRKMILQDYKENMAKRLSKYDNDTFDSMFSSTIRSNNAGEMETYNKLMHASLPEGLMDSVKNAYTGTPDSLEDSIDVAGMAIDQDPVMQEILLSGMDAYGDSPHFSGENIGRRSDMLMNSVMLRGIAPTLSTQALNMRRQYAINQGGDESTDVDEFERLFNQGKDQGVGKKEMDLSVGMQRNVKEGRTSDAGARFKGMMTQRWQDDQIENSLDFGSSAPGYGASENLSRFFFTQNPAGGIGTDRPESAGLYEYLQQRFSDQSKYGDGLTSQLRNASGSINGGGLNIARLASALTGSLGKGMTNEQIGDLYEKLLAGGRYAQLREGSKANPGHSEEMDNYTPEEIEEMDSKVEQGAYELKGIYFAQLRRMKTKYGIMGSQLHPEDFVSKAGPELFDEMGMLQDSEQLMKNTPFLFDFEEKPEDREFQILSDYFNDLFCTITMYATSGVATNTNKDYQVDSYGKSFLNSSKELGNIPTHEAAMLTLDDVPGMDRAQLDRYIFRFKKRMEKNGTTDRLFGRFS